MQKSKRKEFECVREEDQSNSKATSLPILAPVPHRVGLTTAFGAKLTMASAHSMALSFILQQPACYLASWWQAESVTEERTAIADQRTFWTISGTEN